MKTLRIAALGLLLTLPLFGAAEQRPNILVILTDDQGYGDLALHGNTIVDTPRLDALFRESVQLNQFHAAPVCAPTRASLMTGKQFLRAGVWGVHGGRDYLDLRETTVAERLRAAGYATAMAGKWHLGKTDAYLPWNRGFDDSWSITDRLYQHTDPIIDHNGRPLEPKGWTAEILTDYVIEWMTRPRKQPFFCYLAHPYIHEPYYAPEPLIAKYRAKGLSESFARLCAMTEHLDAEIGRLLDKLERAGLARDTVVFFMGDNGPIGNPVNVPHLTDEEMALRNPAGLRGVKGNLYENGTRTPAFVRWPGHFPVRTVEHEVDITDIVPTLLDIAGVPYDPEAFDGHSILPLLAGKADTLENPPRYYANHVFIWPGRKRLYDFLPGKDQLAFDDQVLAVRVGRHKYVMGYGRHELFDIVADPQERHNLAPEQPALADALRHRLREWWTREVLPLPQSYAMPVYVFPETPGRSIFLHGCAPVRIHGGVVQESHDSRQWSRPGDGIDFAIRVPAAGAYRLEALLEPGPAAENARLEVTYRQESLEFSLQRADKVDMGTWNFQAGDSEIAFRLTGNPANDAPAISIFRGVSVTRLPTP